MTHSTPAVILRTGHLREADLWVRFATPQGRLSAIANAALKSKKRFPSGLPIGAQVTIRYHAGKTPDLVTLDEMTIQHSMLGQEGMNHRHLGAVGYALELVDRTWPEHQEGSEKFDCLSAYLADVSRTTDVATALVRFCWQWLGCLGFRPMMTACARCSDPFADTMDWVVLADAGGLVCPSCKRSGERGVPRSEHWERDIAHLWITTVLDLRLNAETWWKLLWSDGQH